MIYGSVCSGIEAATVAWHPLGWRPAFLSEVAPFPRAVLQYHYPAVPLHGDFTTIMAGQYDPIDALVGGTPCQSFSIAGLRGGLDDPRGNLALGFLQLARRLRPRWLVWENVPGVLSSNGGRDFGAFVGGLGELGYGWAYRVLDAQYFGLAQRRKRVFVVGCLGDWRGAAAVLFERHSLSGHPAPRRETGQVAPTVPSHSAAGGGLGTDFDCDGGLVHCPPVSPAMKARDSKGPSSDGDGDGLPLVAVDLKQITSKANGSQPQPVSPTLHEYGTIAVHGTQDPDTLADLAHPLARNNGQENAIAFQSSQSGVREVEAHATLDANNGARRHNGIVQGMAVRRLTPRECERLQGFPDDYTLITYRKKPAKDGPRYKALGNSMAVPVMAWIGRRIQMVHDLRLELAS